MLLNYRYIAAEEIPVKYGGFRRENDSELYNEYEVQEVTVKAGSIGTVELPAPEVISLLFLCFVFSFSFH